MVNARITSLLMKKGCDNMCDFEYLFSTELHKKLKERVIGNVWVKVYHNELHVKITRQDGIEYEFVRDKLDKRILNGYSSDYVAYEVVKEYKSFILNNYFK